METDNQEYIKKNYSFNFSLLMIDALGFGAAYSMMIPTGFVPDVVKELTNSWFLPPLIISIFFLGIFFSQFITSAFRLKETYAKTDVIKWALAERLGIVLLYLTLSFNLNNLGLDSPSWASGVTVPISENPNPRSIKLFVISPFLSNPAAIPIGFGNSDSRHFILRDG